MIRRKEEDKKLNKPRHVTARSRFVEKIFRNYNIKPVSDKRSHS